VPRLAVVPGLAHAGRDARPRVELLDRRVRAVRDQRAGVPEGTPAVGAVRLAGPEAVGEVAVGDRMSELHRRRDAELREAGYVLIGEQLRVLDAVPEAERAPDVLCRLERVQGLAVREVADRVHRGARSPPAPRPT